MSPAGVGLGRGRIRRADSLYQATTPAFHTLMCRHQPAWTIGTKMNEPRRRPATPTTVTQQRQPRVERQTCSAGACPQLGRPRQPPGPTFPVLRLVRNCAHNVIIMKHMFRISRLRRGANVDSYRQPQLVHGTRTRQDMKNAKQMLLQTRTWPG